MDHSALSNLRTKKVYSVEGNIGAGKTTLLKRIGKMMEDVEFVEEPLGIWENLGGESILKKFYEDPIRWGYSFESYSMYSKVEALIKGAQTEKPIIMVERSLLSNKIFFDLSSELGKLDSMEYHMLIKNYEFYIKNIYPQLTGVIYLKTPLEECMRRIKKRSRNGEEGVDRDYISLLEEKFDKFISKSGIPTLNIDGFYDLNTAISQINAFMHPKISKM